MDAISQAWTEILPDTTIQYNVVFWRHIDLHDLHTAAPADFPPPRFLDMHMYITSALQKTDMKAVGLQLALELLHQKVMDVLPLHSWSASHRSSSSVFNLM